MVIWGVTLSQQNKRLSGLANHLALTLYNQLVTKLNYFICQHL
ncbi:MAG: hypothetical protein RLZZ30_1852 [Bacteroidota bacterium]|jgi:hypothetical protein